MASSLGNMEGHIGEHVGIGLVHEGGKAGQRGSELASSGPGGLWLALNQAQPAHLPPKHDRNAKAIYKSTSPMMLLTISLENDPIVPDL